MNMEQETIKESIDQHIEELIKDQPVLDVGRILLFDLVKNNLHANLN